MSFGLSMVHDDGSLLGVGEWPLDHMTAAI